VAAAAILEARRRAGAFYTPDALVDWLVAACVPSSGSPVVLDPACGDGAFLAGVHRHNPRAVCWGLDVDAEATTAAAARLPGARLRTTDALDPAAPPPSGTVDVVVGNPPYVRGRRLSGPRRALLRRRFAFARGQFDLTVPFVERALGWLRPGGRLGFVLPNKVLVAAYARRLREALKTEQRLVEVVDLAGEEGAFGGVCAYPVLVVVERRPPRPDDRVALSEGRLVGGRVEVGAHRELALSDWRGGEAVRLDEAAEAVWSRADLPRLDELATVREAVHTGNVRTKLVVGSALDPSCRPLLRGRDVRRWHVRWAGLYLREGTAVDRAAGEYANLPPAEVFDGPKVLLREIARRPTAAFDAHGHRCLNKAYVVRSRRERSPDSLLSLCGVLNSAPFARLFAARFSASGLRGGHLQYKPQWLGTVPVPPPDATRRAGLPRLVRRLLDGPSPALEAEVDRRVGGLYGWPEESPSAQ